MVPRHKAAIGVGVFCFATLAFGGTFVALAVYVLGQPLTEGRAEAITLVSPLLAWAVTAILAPKAGGI